MSDAEKPNAEADRVQILLALHDGAPNLVAQLDSYEAQSHRNWCLLVSDDASRDEGPDLLDAFALGHPARDTRRIDGPGQGSARNFLHLIGQADATVPFVAFSDQDDVWLAPKLARAVAVLRNVPSDTPALYASRTLICGPDLRILRPSPRWQRPFGLLNALVQNIAAGNTIVLNRTALDLARQSAGAAADAGIVAHDWWLYLVVTSFGGQVIHDPEPTVLYRQHGGNQMGRNDTLAALAARAKLVLQGTYRHWVTANLHALTPLSAKMTAESADLLGRFDAARSSSDALRSRALLLRLGLYRQTILGQAALRGQILLGAL